MVIPSAHFCYLYRFPVSKSLGRKGDRRPAGAGQGAVAGMGLPAAASDGGDTCQAAPARRDLEVRPHPGRGKELVRPSGLRAENPPPGPWRGRARPPVSPPSASDRTAVRRADESLPLAPLTLPFLSFLTSSPPSLFFFPPSFLSFSLHHPQPLSLLPCLPSIIFTSPLFLGLSCPRATTAPLCCIGGRTPWLGYLLTWWEAADLADASSCECN